MMFTVVVVLLSLALVTPGSARDSVRGLQSSSQLWWGKRSHNFPKFLDVFRNLSAIAGDTVFLPCKIDHLGDRTVTWMRARDLHILTVGAFTYSADRRFKCLHPANSVEWTLQIESVVPTDAGDYECQVNSDPKISRKYHLDVREYSQLDDPGILGNSPVTRTSVSIEGGSEHHIEEGSILSLTCVVHHLPQHAPHSLLWFRGENLLHFYSPRRGISIQTEKQLSKTVSKLSLSSVTSSDSGEYICNPDDYLSSVRVIVQKGKKDAAGLQMELNNKGRGIHLSPALFAISIWWLWICFDIILFI